MNSSRSIVAVVAISAALFGAVIGTWNSPSHGDILVLSVRPLERNRVVEGENVKVEFAVTNSSDKPVEISQLSGSCGCMKIADELDSELILPFALQAGSRMKLFVEIATINATGFRDYGITVNARAADDRELSRQCSTRLFIEGLMRTEPTELRFEGHAAGTVNEAVVNIYDGIQPDGISVDSIQHSSPSVTTRLELLDEPLPVDGGLMLRSKIHVRYCPDRADTPEEFIEIRPQNKQFRSIRIPIYSNELRREIAILPNPLVVPSSPSIITRTVSCILTSTHPLEVIDAPLEMKSSIAFIDSLRALVTLEIPPGRTDYIIKIGNPQTPETAATLHIVLR